MKEGCRPVPTDIQPDGDLTETATGPVEGLNDHPSSSTTRSSSTAAATTTNAVIPT
jgi:hypothetical protein